MKDRTWKCPRCGVECIVTDEGINHACNVNGAFWQKYSVEELDWIEEWNKKQMDGILYGERSYDRKD